MGKIQKLKEAKAGGVLILTIFLWIRRKILKVNYGEKEVNKQNDADLQNIERVIIRKLRKKYSRKAELFKKEIDEHYKDIDHIKSNKIWILWLQGIEQAPPIVKLCYQSVQKHKPDNLEICLLDEKNLSNWINLPEYIVELYNSKKITFQLYSDLIRLELLTKYGGTWIDATVFLSSKNYPGYIFDSKLFLYQSMFPATWGLATVMNSWFITSDSGEKILELTKRLIFDYFKVNKYSCDYWLIYDFFEIAKDLYPNEFSAIIPQSVEDTHILQPRLCQEYNRVIFEETLRISSVHKLQWRIDNSDLTNGDTMFNHLYDLF